MSDGRHLVAGLARDDVNMPCYDGSTMDFLLRELQFEADVCALVQPVPAVLTSRLVDYHAPVQHAGPRLDIPKDIAGRRLMVFERAEGENNVWRQLSSEGKVGDYAITIMIALLPLFFCDFHGAYLVCISDLGLSAFSSSSDPRVPVQPRSARQFYRDLAPRTNLRLHAQGASPPDRPFAGVLGCNVRVQDQCYHWRGGRHDRVGG